jgi:hypothetical protein
VPEEAAQSADAGAVATQRFSPSTPYAIFSSYLKKKMKASGQVGCWCADAQAFLFTSFQAKMSLYAAMPATPAAAPNPFDSPEALALTYGFGWNALPQWYLDREAARSTAYLAGRRARRDYDYKEGGFLTLPDRRVVMVYRGHIYELPKDRAYFTPGPLNYIGLYDRTTRTVDTTLAGPEIHQTLEGYPWTNSYAIYAARQVAI